MTLLTRQNPWNDLRTLQARFFEPFFGRFDFDEQMGGGTWAPPVDVAEENDRLLVRVEVPGMNQSDLKVHLGWPAHRQRRAHADEFTRCAGVPLLLQVDPGGFGH